MKKSRSYSADPERGGGHCMDSLFNGNIGAARTAYSNVIRGDSSVERVQPSCITAVTICVNYSDYFEHCLEANHDQLDEWIVVTSSEDTSTQEMVSRYDNVKLVITDCFFYDGASFNKGCAINLGLEKIPEREDIWALILDADIILPKNFREVFFSKKLDISTLYGAPRHFARNIAEYIDYRDNPDATYKSFPKRQYFRKSPIGYFQMFHSINLQRPSLKKLKPYPDEHPDATTSDMVFMQKFSKRSSISGAPVIHLGDDGKNWYGRVTEDFNLNTSRQNFTYTPDYADSNYKRSVRNCLNAGTRKFDDDILDYLHSTKVYISLTTSPKRLNKILYPLNTLDLSFVSSILLSLPDKYRDEEEYDLSDDLYKDPRIKLIRGEKDLGPINKFLPALKFLKETVPDSILITIDDDTLYPIGMISELIIGMRNLNNTVLTASAPDLSFWEIDYKDWPSEDTKVSEGFAGIAYKVSDISDEAVFEMEEMSQNCKSCKFSDDIVHSYVLAKYGLRTNVVNNSYYSLSRINQLDYGFQSDAIFKSSGLPEFKEILDSADVRPDGINMHKYKDCVIKLNKGFV